MVCDSLDKRIQDQFSFRSERADIWRGFDRFLNTEAFLNLGYSEWYQPLFLGSSQRRLADRIGATFADRLPVTDGVSLLDVGCGRGGPAIHLAKTYGFTVTGIDLVPYNVAVATANAMEEGVSAEFVVGDATALPFISGAFPTCVALDIGVYIPDKAAYFEEVTTVLQSKGVAVFSDLVMDDTNHADTAAVNRFADAWDMAPLPTLDQYLIAMDAAGLTVCEVEDISQHSVRRFRKWTTLYLMFTTSPFKPGLEWVLQRWDLNPAAITKQIRHARTALPHLRHVLISARR